MRSNEYGWKPLGTTLPPLTGFRAKNQEGARGGEGETLSKRNFQPVLFTCILAVTSWAADNPFVGKWKLDPAKSTLTDQMKVRAAGENKYALDFGSGNEEIIVADGSDQTGLFGTTLAITVEDPNTLKVVRKREGRMLISATWKLSDDGTTLTDAFTGYRPNGSTYRLDYVYKRKAAGSGFAGTWESTKEQRDSAYEIEIQTYQGDGLSFVNHAQESTKSMRFDGKDYPTVGPNIPQGYASSGSRLNERTVEMTDKINGTALDTQQIEVSPDLRTLTMTLRPSSQGRPKDVLVFDRE